MKRSSVFGLILAAALAASLHAQEALPKGDTIIDKYIDATGGRDAYTKLKSTVWKGTMDIAAQGISGTMTFYRAEPNLSRMVLDIPGVGKVEEGVTGGVAWANSAMQGPRIKEGEEKAMALLGAAFNAELNWREFYKTAETTGVEDVNGQPCYKVVVTPKEGSPQTRLYDKKTGLLTKMTMTTKTPMGEIPFQTLLADYRDEGGIKMPHKLTQSAMGQEFVITISEVKMNAPIDKAQFDLPAEVKALLDKK